MLIKTTALLRKIAEVEREPEMIIHPIRANDEKGTPDKRIAAVEKLSPDPERRIIAKKGREYLVFRLEEIAYFCVENGVSHLINRKSNYKYITSKPLCSLESAISSPSFFRVSKKYLIHVDAVVKFRALKGGKLELLLSPDPGETIIISQLKAQTFKRWLVQC